MQPVDTALMEVPCLHYRLYKDTQITAESDCCRTAAKYMLVCTAAMHTHAV
jgi:hypothetical protein